MVLNFSMETLSPYTVIYKLVAESECASEAAVTMLILTLTYVLTDGESPMERTEKGGERVCVLHLSCSSGCNRATVGHGPQSTRLSNVFTQISLWWLSPGLISIIVKLVWQSVWVLPNNPYRTSYCRDFMSPPKRHTNTHTNACEQMGWIYKINHDNSVSNIYLYINTDGQLDLEDCK